MLGKNQIVELRNGLYGAVASFNDKPFQIIFTAYTTPVRRYDENLKNKNTSYDIVRIYDGSSIEDITVVFKNKFTPENLPVIWEGNIND